MNEEEDENVSELLSDWLQQQNILGKVISFLKNSLVGVQDKPVLHGFKSKRNCPKIQSLKLLLADFLIHYEYLFTFSIFVTEVPFLSDVIEFSSYITRITERNDDTLNIEKPYFSSDDAKYILQALGFHADCRFIREIVHYYEQNKIESFISCIFHQLKIYMENYCSLEGKFEQLLEKEKYCEKITADQKVAIENCGRKLEKYEIILSEHKQYFKKVSEHEENNKAIAAELNLQREEVAKLQNNLKEREKHIRAKEDLFERNKNAATTKLEKWASTLKNQQSILEEKYEKLLMDKTALKKEQDLLKSERENLAHMENAITVKYEKKFVELESELLAIREILSATTKKNNTSARKDQNIQITMDTVQSKAIKPNMIDKSEQVNMNNEQYVFTVLSEMHELKNGLNSLRTELHALKRHESSRANNDKGNIAGVAAQEFNENSREQLKRLYNEILSRGRNIEEVNKSLSNRRQNIDITSSDNSKDSATLTDDIVEEAKHKLQQLEKESETLDKNFQNLQSILGRNLIWNFDRSDYSASRIFSEPGSLPPGPRSSIMMNYLHSLQNYRAREGSVDSDTSPQHAYTAAFSFSPRNLDRAQRKISTSAMVKEDLNSPFDRLFSKRLSSKSIVSPTDDRANISRFGRYRSKCIKKLQFDAAIPSSDLSSDDIPKSGSVEVQQKQQEQHQSDPKLLSDEKFQDKFDKNIYNDQKSKPKELNEQCIDSSKEMVNNSKKPLQNVDTSGNSNSSVEFWK